MLLAGYPLKLLFLIHTVFSASTFNYLNQCTDTNRIIKCGRSLASKEDIIDEDNGNVLTIENCQFYNCPRVKILTPAIFRNVSFDSSTAGINLLVKSNVTLENITVTNNARGILGFSPIRIDKDGYVQAYNSTFANNSVNERGGAFYVLGKLMLQNCFFQSNLATNSRGADIFVDAEGQLDWDGGESMGTADSTKIQTPSGGSIAALSSNVSIKNVVFSGQRVSQFGGVLYLESSSHATLMNITVYNVASTQVSGFGGAFRLLQSSTLKCTECRVWNSTANQGGILSIEQNSHALLQKCHFNQSQAVSYGGCILLNAFSSVTLENTLLSECATINKNEDVMGSGGAIYAQHFSNITLQDSRIEKSYGQFGGGLFILDGLLTTRNTTFDQNHGEKYGGAVYTSDTDAVFQDTVFIRNVAGNDGGALMVLNPLVQNKSVEFRGVARWIENKASRRGGAISSMFSMKMFFSTSVLVMTKNSAPIGSSVDVRQEFINSTHMALPEDFVNGDVVYKGTLPVDIDGVWWFENVQFGAYVMRRQSLPLVGFPLDSRPIRLALIDPVGLSEYQLPWNLKIPRLTLSVHNVFDKPFLSREMNITDPIIVNATLLNHQNQTVFQMFKGILYDDQVSVTFKETVLPLGRAVFNGTRYRFLFSTLFGVDSSSNVTFTDNVTRSFDIIMPSCAQGFQIVPMARDQRNITTFACLPLYSVSLTNRKHSVEASIALFMLTLATGVIIYHRRHLRVYKRRTLFSTYAILTGCLIQFASIWIRFQPGKNECVLMDVIELVGFIIVTCTLVLKTVQMRRIFLGSKRLRGFARPMSPLNMSKTIAASVIVTLVFMLVWLTTEEFDIQDSVFPTYIEANRCVNKKYGFLFPLISLLIRFFMECLAVYAVYSVRQIQSVYAEKKEMALIAYAWFMCNSIMVPIEQNMNMLPDHRYAFSVARTLIPTCVTVLILFPRAVTRDDDDTL